MMMLAMELYDDELVVDEGYRNPPTAASNLPSYIFLTVVPKPHPTINT